MHRLRHLLAWVFALMLWMPTGAAQAQATLDKAQLDQLTAPVALYPDALLSQVLMAATYPADVAAASQWSKSHSSLSGDAATKAAATESWDPSVLSLVAFPSVIDMMGRQPQWVKSIGDAFLAQPNDVMDSVQRLRAQAQKAGSLKTTEQQKVVTQTTGGTTIVQIEPANPQVVYVPSYNPTVVYGAWPYPAYPPAYYPPPPRLRVRHLAGCRHRVRPRRGGRRFAVGRIQLGRPRRQHQRQPLQQHQRQQPARRQSRQRELAAQSRASRQRAL